MKRELQLTLGLAAWLLVLPAAAQDSNGAQPDCRLAPQVDADASLAERLDACNGVLKPPKVGDSDIVEPAPQVGETPVIRPGELPPQQAPDGEERIDPVVPAPNYSVSELVDAIGNAGTTVQQISEPDIQSVDVRDISSLMAGAAAAVINTALAEHGDALARLQKLAEELPTLSAALSKRGFSARNVVAAKLEPSARLTVFARSGP